MESHNTLIPNTAKLGTDSLFSNQDDTRETRRYLLKLDL